MGCGSERRSAGRGEAIRRAVGVDGPGAARRGIWVDGARDGMGEVGGEHGGVWAAVGGEWVNGGNRRARRVIVRKVPVWNEDGCAGDGGRAGGRPGEWGASPRGEGWFGVYGVGGGCGGRVWMVEGGRGGGERGGVGGGGGDAGCRWAGESGRRGVGAR